MIRSVTMAIALLLPVLCNADASISALEIEGEAIIEYLSRYSADYQKISLHYNLPVGTGHQVQLIVKAKPDGNEIVRSQFEAHPDGKQHFDSLCNLLLDPENADIPGQWLEALKDAWYWDFRVLHNPVLHELLAKRLSGDTSLLPYWKYRIAILERGRKATWQTMIEHPETVARFNADMPSDPETICKIHECMDYQSNAVFSLVKSRLLLDELKQVVIERAHQGSSEHRLNKLSPQFFKRQLRRHYLPNDWQQSNNIWYG
jgi:hypothetical protein